MKFIFSFFFLCLISNNFFAQSNLWYITRGLDDEDRAWAVDVDSAGCVYWATEQKDVWPYWYYNIIMYKIDSASRQIWQSASWGNGTGFNDIAFVAKVNGTNVYLCGRTDSTGSTTSGDALVLSYDTSAGFNWAKNITPNPDSGYQEIDGVTVMPDGIYLTGWTQGQTTDMDFLIQKIDFSGNTVWINSWDYDSLGKFDGANGHMAMDNNFIYAAGHVGRTNYISLDGQMGLACFSRSNGNYQWDVTWGGALYDDALGMTMSADSMLYVVGYTGSFGNGSQIYLNKYSRTGQLKWSRLWGGSGTEDSRALVTAGDSMIYVVGATGSYGNGAKDVFVLKFDSAGTLLDSLFWGGSYNETIQDVAMHGCFLYLTGQTESFGNGAITGNHKADGLLLKINGCTMQAPDTLMTVSSEIAKNNSGISVFPNPCSEKFQVTSSNLQITGLDIYNCVGEKIYSLSVHSKSAAINLENQPEGIYVLKIQTTGNSFTQKLILIR